jgi:hypothetical protein
MRRSLHRLAVIALAISVFTAMSVAPVAAADGVNIGDDDSVSIGTDGVSIGGDEGIDINTSSGDGIEVSAGGDRGVEVGADTEDGVEIGAGGDSGVEVGAGTEDGVDVAVGGDRGVEVGADTENGVDVDAAGEDAAGIDSDGVSVAGEDIGGDGIESLPVENSGGIGGVDGNPSDVTSEIDGLAGGDHGVETLPDDSLSGAGDSIPSQDFPIGGEDAPINACDTLDIGTDDLPAESLPGLDDLPSGVVPSGVPTDLLSTQALLGIALGIIPAPCEVFNPNDPPYDPITGDDEFDPAQDEEIQYIGENDGGILAVVLYDATLNESGNGPGISTVTAIGANPDYGDIDLRYGVKDGEKEYAVDPRLRYNDERIWGEAKLVLLGKNLGAGVSCERPEQVSLDLGELQEDPLGPCEYTVIGLMNPPIGPAQLIDILLGAGDSVGEEPLLPGEELPINPDDLLSL